MRQLQFTRLKNFLQQTKGRAITRLALCFFFV